MSGCQLPFHIQIEIMKRLPVRSLVRFRSVSKAWKSLIDSREFIVEQSIRRHTQPHHLLVWYGNPVEDVNYLCYVDDVTFPQQRSVPTLPQSVKRLTLPTVIGTSHGLLCMYGSEPHSTTKMAVIWNPSIKKSNVVDVPYGPTVGFGVCPLTSDPKIVAIKQSQDFNHCEARVYSLSSGKWNPASNLPTERICDAWSPVVTDRFIYWVAGRTPTMIMSFDVSNETFELIDLLDSVASNSTMRFAISKLRESLAMLEIRENTSTVVWMIEDGVQRSFTKLFTIQASVDSIVGFRKSGIPIMLVTDDDYDGQCKFVVYEPNSEYDNVLEIPGPSYWFNINSFMETLLLLDRSDCQDLAT